MFHDVRDGQGRLIFRYDPELDLVEVKMNHVVHQVSLYAQRQRLHIEQQRREAAVEIPLEIAAQS